MDFHLKQWRNQQNESEQQEEEQEQENSNSVKIPRLFLDNTTTNESQQQYSSLLTTSSSSTAAPLPLFVPEEVPSCNKISNLSAFSDSTQLPPSNTTRSFQKMGGGSGGGGNYFSWAQRQELELQALIYKYMLAGAVVPPELLQPIKKSLLLHHSPPYFLHHPLQHYSYYQPALLQTGYWGRAAMDPEPGRCRRTDGKKWRCSRDVVAGQKYCERHVHRGRNRSRKPVEIPTSISTTNNAATIGGGGGGGGAAFNNCSSILAPPPLGTVVVNNGNNNNNTFSFTGQSSSTQFLHHNNGPSETQFQIKGGLLLGGGQHETAEGRDGRILRHFFDDWPRSESDDHGGNSGGAGQMNTATCLSISMPGNTASDVSLKLATGDDGEEAEVGGVGGRGNEREVQPPQLNWNGGWGSAHVASMGGPLAEALRSSTSNSSPTSVLHHLPRASASETSFVSA